eukprot:TRINITY_DN10849_c0_g1_i1.p1 TRINITY_DN10849_c0_g1~~TRINITY_DN10849_c0_g1_i1.p1  ORF type:complete len:407 (+),score=62.25 TRINITY_DN10849_c0_g1_i1:263-1483(+)
MRSQLGFADSIEKFLVWIVLFQCLSAVGNGEDTLLQQVENAQTRARNRLDALTAERSVLAAAVHVRDDDGAIDYDPGDGSGEVDEFESVHSSFLQRRAAWEDEVLATRQDVQAIRMGFERLWSTDEQSRLASVEAADFKIHFVNVPASGSLTVTSVLRNYLVCYPTGPCCDSSIAVRGLCRGKRPCARLIGCSGHLPQMTLFDVKRKRREPFHVITLRDPMTRVVGAFASRGQHGGHASIMDYVMDPRYQNVVTKMLSQDVAAYSYAEDATEDDFNKAFSYIGRFDAPIILEYYDISLHVLFMKTHHTIGVSRAAQGMVHKRETTINLPPETLAEVDLDVVASKNRYDVQLRAEALRLLCHDVFQFQKILQNKVSWSRFTAFCDACQAVGVKLTFIGEEFIHDDDD